MGVVRMPLSSKFLRVYWRKIVIFGQYLATVWKLDKIQ